MLNELKNKYFFENYDNLDSFDQAQKKYSKQKASSLIDIFLTSSNLGINILNDNIDPLLLKAIKETNPNFNPSLISNLSENELNGIINSTKGKYFEYQVVDKLNSGNQVGDIKLPNGYKAELAEKFNQPGWDIKIIDESGKVSEFLQLKATNSIGYLNETLEKYPDIRILATEEVSRNFSDEFVLDSNFSNSELSSKIQDYLNEEISFELIDVFTPLIPLVLMISMEGYGLIIGKKTLNVFLENLKIRSGRIVTSSFIGSAVYSIGGGLILSLSGAIISSLIYDEIILEKKVYETLHDINNKNMELAKYIKSENIKKMLK